MPTLLSPVTAQPPSSPYSVEYDTIAQEGHKRQTSALGAPTLSWHVAIWPHWFRDAQDTRLKDFEYTGEIGPKGRPEVRLEMPTKKGREEREEQGTPKECPRLTNRDYNQAVDEYNRRREDVILELNELLDDLQSRGRSLERKRFEFFNPSKPRIEDGTLRRDSIVEFCCKNWKNGKRSLPLLIRPESIVLTLWWGDTDGPQTTCPEDPTIDYIRVRLHAEAYMDFVSLTFHLDVQKPYDRSPLNDYPTSTKGPIPGARRFCILRVIAHPHASV